MKLGQYRKAWNRLTPGAMEKLKALEMAMRGHGFQCKLWQSRAGDEEWRYDLLISNADGYVAMVDYTLYDGDVRVGYEGFGLAIGFSCAGPDAQLGSAYKPYAYTQDAFTQDVDELAQRIADCPVQELATAVCDDIARWARRASIDAAATA